MMSSSIYLHDNEHVTITQTIKSLAEVKHRFLCILLNFPLAHFLQLVEKHYLVEMRNKTAIWCRIYSDILVSKINIIWQSLLKLQSIHTAILPPTAHCQFGRPCSNHSAYYWSENFSALMRDNQQPHSLTISTQSHDSGACVRNTYLCRPKL